MASLCSTQRAGPAAVAWKEGHLLLQINTKMSCVSAAVLVDLHRRVCLLRPPPCPGAGRPWAINAVIKQINATIS